MEMIYVIMDLPIEPDDCWAEYYDDDERPDEEYDRFEDELNGIFNRY